ncbi:unnamed protein product [Closterium sp. NIES-53]
MQSRLLVSGLPRSLPPLPPSPAPPCLPCVEGRQRAAPHSSSFPPTTAPLQTLHMDMWGPARDLPVLRLHYDRGGEFSSDLLRYFCRGEGILQSFTLPHSPQQNGIAEHRIGLVMEVARTSMIHAAAPHFRWPFAVRYAAHQLNLWPCVSLPETSPTLHWTGKVGDASVFRFYHPTSRRVFPSQDVTFDESVLFYRLFPYRSAPPPPLSLFLAPGPPPVDPLPPQGPTPSGVSQVDPLSGTPPVEVAVGSGAASGGAASRGAASGGAEPGGVESRGAEHGAAESEGAECGGVEPGVVERGGAEPAGVEPGGAESEGVEPRGAEFEGAKSGGAEPRSIASSGGLAGVPPRKSPRPEPLSPLQLREWFTQRTCLRSGADGAGASAAGDTGAGGDGFPAQAGGSAAAGPGGARTRGTRAAGTGGAGVAGAGDPTEPRAAGAGGAGAVGVGVGGTGAGGAGARGAGAVDPGAGDAGGTVRLRPYFVPLSQPPLQPASPLPAPSPYTEQTGGLRERRELASRPASPVRIGHRVPRARPPAVPVTHAMALRPSSVPLCVPLPPPPKSSLPVVPDPESDCTHAASPTVSRLLAIVVTDPSFESTATCALVAELVDFAAEDFECLAAAVLRFASMLFALEGDPDAPDIPTPRSYAEAIRGPYSSQWQAAMDAEMASKKSTGTYVDTVPPSRANIVDGMWICRVKLPPISPPAFKARYVARGFSQRQGVDYFQTFSPP